MSNGWTGGQYSLFRAILGGWLLVAAGRWLPGQPLALLVIVASLLLAIGWWDRLAAAVLFGGAVWWLLQDRETAAVYWPFASLLLFHVFTPPAPYGSWAARGRVDPGNGWHIPSSIETGPWLFVGYAIAARWSVSPALALLVLALAFSATVRPWLWCVCLVIHAPQVLAAGDYSLLLLHIITFDPGWIPPRGTPTERLFFDGNCGLCHRAVRFVLAEDRTGTAFRFAPLDSDALRAALTDEQRRSLPDSLVVLTTNGAVLTRWRGMVHIAQRLGGFWRVLGMLAGLVPAAVGEVFYDGLARIRHRLFARPHDACPVLPPGLRQRFDW